MQKIDRLDWAAGFCFVAYGVRVGVRSNSPEVIRKLLEWKPTWWKLTITPYVQTIYSLKVGQPSSRRGFKQFHLIYANFEQVGRTLDLEQAISLFEQDIHLHVAENASRRVFVHSGVIGWHGQAILIPGKSLSGKSTLVRELIKAGATYYSDEYAVLDAKGQVHPYPLPLGVRHHPLEKQAKIPVESIGGTVGAKPLPVGMVLITSFKQDARWRPQLISAGQSLLALLSNTVSAQRNPAKALAVLEQVVLRAPGWQSRRGEASAVVGDILARL